VIVADAKDDKSAKTLIEMFLAEKRDRYFHCPSLDSRITYDECVARQTRPSRKHKAGGKEREYKIVATVDHLCRSGECELGKQNSVKLIQLRGKK